MSMPSGPSGAPWTDPAASLGERPAVVAALAALNAHDGAASLAVLRRCCPASATVEPSLRWLVAHGLVTMASDPRVPGPPSDRRTYLLTDQGRVVAESLSAVAEGLSADASEEDR